MVINKKKIECLDCVLLAYVHCSNTTFLKKKKKKAIYDYNVCLFFLFNEVYSL